MTICLGCSIARLFLNCLLIHFNRNNVRFLLLDLVLVVQALHAGNHM